MLGRQEQRHGDRAGEEQNAKRNHFSLHRVSTCRLSASDVDAANIGRHVDDVNMRAIRAARACSAIAARVGCLDRDRPCPQLEATKTSILASRRLTEWSNSEKLTVT